MTVSQPLNKVKSYFMFFTSIQQKTTKHFSSIKTLAPFYKLIKKLSFLFKIHQLLRLSKL